MGALVGGGLGLAIGVGTAGEDLDDTREGNRQGSVILSGTFDAERAQEAVKIMDQATRKFQESSARTST